MKKLFLLSLILLAGCKEAVPPAFEPPAVPVHAAVIETRDVPLYFESMGTVKYSVKADVKAQVEGIITGVHFQEGQTVEKGDLLYTIEEAPYALRVRELEATLYQNSAHLENARKKWDRHKSLPNQDIISKVQWDEAEANVALYEGMVKADSARLGAAQLDLEHCRIVAPISGRAGKTSLQIGNMVSLDSLVTVSQEEPIMIEFELTESEMEKLPAIATVQAYAAGRNEFLGNGIVMFVDHCLDKNSGMFAAKCELFELQKPLWEGQSVRVHVFFGKKENAKLIPLKAIKTNQSGPYVYCIKEDQTVEMRSLKLGPEEKGMVVVEEGLDDISKVVTEGQLLLFPGSKIKEIE